MNSLHQVQMVTSSRIELPVMLRASAMDRGGLHTWLATRKADADKKREEEVGFYLLIVLVSIVFIVLITGGRCRQQPMAGKEFSASSGREEERGIGECGPKLKQQAGEQ